MPIRFWQLCVGQAASPPVQSDPKAGAALLFVMTIAAVLAVFLLALMLLVLRRSLRTKAGQARPTPTEPDIWAEAGRRIQLADQEDQGGSRS